MAPGHYRLEAGYVLGLSRPPDTEFDVVSGGPPLMLAVNHETVIR